MVVVDQIQRRMALGLLVGDALDDPVRVKPVLAQGLPLRVSEVRFVDGEDYATDTWNKVELVGRCCRPRRNPLSWRPIGDEGFNKRERERGLKQMKAELTTNVAESCGLAVIFIFES